MFKQSLSNIGVPIFIVHTILNQRFKVNKMFSFTNLKSFILLILLKN